MSMSPGWRVPGGLAGLAPGWVSGAGRPPEVVATWGDITMRTMHLPVDEADWVVLVEPNELRQWWEPAPDATSDIDHWTGDGTVRGLLRRSARTVEIGGVVHAVDQSRLLAGKRAFAAQRLAKLVVGEPALATEADVRLVSLRWSDLNLHVARFSLTLLAGDPLRYGAASLVLKNGANLLVNRGDADAFPVISVMGPHDGYTIEHPEGVFHYPAVGTATRIVDCRNGDVWRLATGERVFPGVSGPWPVVPAGGATWKVSGLGSGPASVSRFEAWS